MQRRDIIKYSMLLLGAAAGQSVSRALYAGITAASAIPGTDGFTAVQRQSVTQVVDMIIPTTDTPGAVAAGVPNFIEVMVWEWYTKTERRIFLQGLDELDSFCAEQTGRQFHEAHPELRLAALQELERRSSDHERAVTDHSPHGGAETFDQHAPFFHKIKELTVLGYYTSEIGATQELVYRPLPGYFDGDLSLDQSTRQYSH